MGGLCLVVLSTPSRMMMSIIILLLNSSFEDVKEFIIEEVDVTAIPDDDDRIGPCCVTQALRP